MRRRFAIHSAVAALVLATSSVARADPAADLEKAHNAYAAHQYEEAEARLLALLDPATGSLTDPDGVADARMYLGATLVAEKKNERAFAIFAQLLTDRPDYQPDALKVSLDAIDAFTDARARARDKLAAIQAERVRRAQGEKARADAERQRSALRLAMLEKLAATEVVTEHNSRWMALVPFGVGQFQNGQTALGWTLLVSEGLLAVGSGVGAAVSYYNVQQRNDAYGQGQAFVAGEYNQRAQTSAIVGDAFAAGLLAVAVAGIVQAEVTFVPETSTTRPRAIPTLSLAPTAGGWSAGLTGRF